MDTSCSAELAISRLYRPSCFYVYQTESTGRLSVSTLFLLLLSQKSRPRIESRVGPVGFRDTPHEGVSAWPQPTFLQYPFKNVNSSSVILYSGWSFPFVGKFAIGFKIKKPRRVTNYSAATVRLFWEGFMQSSARRENCRQWV